MKTLFLGIYYFYVSTDVASRKVKNVLLLTLWAYVKGSSSATNPQKAIMALLYDEPYYIVFSQNYVWGFLTWLMQNEENRRTKLIEIVHKLS